MLRPTPRARRLLELARRLRAGRRNQRHAGDVRRGDSQLVATRVTAPHHRLHRGDGRPSRLSDRCAMGTEQT